MRIYFLVFLIISCNCFGQSISGYVSDSETSDPLIMANVFLDGKKYGCATDQSGYYNLKLPNVGTFKINYQYIGYISRDTLITINKDQSLNINMNLLTIDTTISLIYFEYQNKIQNNINMKVMLNQKNDNKSGFMLSVKNNSKDTIYLPTDILLKKMIRFTFYDKDKKEIQIYGCILLNGFEEMYEMYDFNLIRVLPGYSYNYKKCEFNFIPEESKYFSISFGLGSDQIYLLREKISKISSSKLKEIINNYSIIPRKSIESNIEELN